MTEGVSIDTSRETDEGVILDSKDKVIEVPGCPLVKGDKCDVAFLRSRFPEEFQKKCSDGGCCVVRKIGNLEGVSMVSLVNNCIARKKPIPIDKIQVAIDMYCKEQGNLPTSSGCS